MIPALATALLHFLWQGALIAFALWIALTLLRRSAPNARYAACAAALVLMTAAPAVTMFALLERPAPVRAAADIVFTLAAASIAPAAPSLVLRQWIVPGWALGVVIFALRLTFAWRHVARLRRTATPVDSPLMERAHSIASRIAAARPVRILVSAVAEAPCVVGWLKPVILIPASALAGLDAAQLEAILAHELAHIRRHDYLANLLQTIVETLLFYHPAVWWVSARMRQERELCCDDLAVRCCGDALVYARALTRVERLRTAPVTVVAATGGSLLYRIQRLTGGAHESAPSRLPLVLALLALALPLAPHRAAATQKPAAPAPATQPAPRQPPAQAAKAAPETVVLNVTLDANGIALDAKVVEGPLARRAQALRWVLGRKLPKANPGNDNVTVSLVVGDKGIIEMRMIPRGQALQGELEKTRQQLAEINLQADLDQLAREKANLEAELNTLRITQLQSYNETRDLQKTKLDAATNLLRQLAAQMEQRRKSDSLNHPEMRSLEAQIASEQHTIDKLAEDQASQMRRDTLNAALIAQHGRLQDARDPGQIAAIKTQIAETETQLAASMRGAKLRSIDRGPLPADIELPVKSGDALTATSMAELIETIRKADPALEIRFHDEGDNQISIRIVRPQ